MTVPTRAELLDHAANGTLLDSLFDEYTRHGPDRERTIEAIASAHNEGAIDVLALITPDSLATRGGYKFFRGQQVYCDLIPKIEASAEKLLRVVDALIVAGGNDGAAGVPANALGKWCEANPARPAEILALVDRGVPCADQFLIMALTRGSAVDPAYFTDRAFAFLKTGSHIERLAAIGALGRIKLDTVSEWKRLVAAFGAAITPDPGDDQRRAVLAAVVLRLKTAPVAQKAELIDIALNAIAPLGDLTQYECARTLALHNEDIDARLVDAFLEALKSIDPSRAGTIEMLDFGLTKLVEGGEPSKARAFIEELLLKNDGTLKIRSFDSVCYSLSNGDRRTLEEWIVSWLRVGKFSLCSQLNELSFGAEPAEIVFAIDFTRYALSEAEFTYLARKTIGVFFLKPVVMASLVTSLLRSAPPQAAKEIEELLLEPILLNYSSAASNYLKLVANDSRDPAATAARRALDGLQEYLDGLLAIGHVPELHPSERERQLEWQRHSDYMAEIHREAEKSSILGQLARKSVLLHGNRSVWYAHDPGGSLRRVESKLGSFGASFEVPRVDIVDPLGLQLLLTSFRFEIPPA